MKNKNLVNAKNLIELSLKYEFAIPHININNLEWIHAVIDSAILANTPVIIGVSHGAIKYMGGYNIVYNMVNDYMNFIDCKVPIILHLDHGTYEGCIDAINAGFTSVMFDGSKLPIDDNLILTEKLILLCKKHNVSIETEVGSIGGIEDGITSNGEMANLDDCIKMSKLPIDFLAAGIGNIHGLYPSNWAGLNFDLLNKIFKSTNIPIVLHGGSGISDEQIKKAIKLGVRKINVNTECQIAAAQCLYNLFTDSAYDIFYNKNYDPRKYLSLLKQAIINVCVEKYKLFNCYNILKIVGN